MNNKLKEPRRLKKDPMAQTSINAFFTKQDGTPKNMAAHNGNAGKSSAEPHMQIKSEKVSDDEVSDAETEINFGAIPPQRVKDEPMDAIEAPGNGTVVPKMEPEYFPPSDEDTDVEMDIDPTLANDSDPMVNIKTEPIPVQSTVASILSRVNESISNASPRSTNAKSDDVYRPVVKKEPEEYPPSDEATDEELDIDSTLATELDPAIKVKTESTRLDEREVEKVAWILSKVQENESAAHSKGAASPTIATSKSNRVPVLGNSSAEFPTSDGAADEEMDIDQTLAPELDPTVKVKNEPSFSERCEEDKVANILRLIPSLVKETDSDAQSESLPSTSSSILPAVKRRHDNYLEKDGGKKQSAFGTSRREHSCPSSSVANKEREREADSNEVANIQNLSIAFCFRHSIEKQIFSSFQTHENMFCEDEVLDDEQTDVDAQMLELIDLIKEKMAEEDPKALSALIDRLDDLAAAQLKKANRIAADSLEKQMKEQEKMLNDFIRKYIGEKNLDKWDHIIGHKKKCSGSAGPSEESKPKSTKAGDAQLNAVSDSTYARFMNKPLPKPFPIKPEDKKVEREKIIRRIVVQHLQPRLTSKSINEITHKFVVAQTIDHFLTMNCEY